MPRGSVSSHPISSSPLLHPRISSLLLCLSFSLVSHLDLISSSSSDGTEKNPLPVSSLDPIEVAATNPWMKPQARSISQLWLPAGVEGERESGRRGEEEGGESDEGERMSVLSEEEEEWLMRIQAELLEELRKRAEECEDAGVAVGEAVRMVMRKIVAREVEKEGEEEEGEEEEEERRRRWRQRRRRRMGILHWLWTLVETWMGADMTELQLMEFGVDGYWG